MDVPTVLKLGGSLLTEKDRRETVDEGALDAAADALATRYATPDAEADPRAADPGLVLVHGGGSFGHPAASDAGASTTRGTRDAPGGLAVHEAMKRLNRAVVGRLQDRSVPALPVHPMSLAARDAGGDLAVPLASVETLLGEGFVPVLHGDGVAHAGEGVSVLSGDELVVRLARDLDASRVGLCSTVPGVLDGEGDVVPAIEAFEDVADVLGGSDATDVTGGMAGKVRTLLDLSTPAYVFGPDGLDAFLDGGSPGTRIGGR